MSDIIKLAHIVPQRGLEASIAAMAITETPARVPDAFNNEILVSLSGFGYMQPEGASARPIPLKTRISVLNLGFTNANPGPNDLFVFESNSEQYPIKFSELATAIGGTVSGELGSIRWLLEQADDEYTWALQESNTAFEYFRDVLGTPTATPVILDPISSDYQYTFGTDTFDARIFVKTYIREITNGLTTGKMSHGIQLDNMKAFIEFVVGGMDLGGGEEFDGKIPFLHATTDGTRFLKDYFVMRNKLNPTTSTVGTQSAIDITSIIGGDLTSNVWRDHLAFRETASDHDPFESQEAWIVPFYYKDSSSPDMWTLSLNLNMKDMKRYIEWKLQVAQADFTVIDGGTWE